MKHCFIYILLFFVAICSYSQTIELDKGWQFRQAGTQKWYAATVPGSVHGDLFQNKLIPDPFYSDHEKKLEWIDNEDWEYRRVITAGKKMLASKNILLSFEGLDTYADVYVNDKLVFKADNFFRKWEHDIKKWLRPGNNELRVYFHSAKNITDSLAKAALPLVLPDNPRVYARKAQYQFGWDWGPEFIGAGIWRSASLTFSNREASENYDMIISPVELVQEKDSIGTSFFFTDGKPVYVKGANWIPAHAFPGAVKKEDYRQLLTLAKEAGMNMLRVWGGGVYEDDYFYDLCDSLDIMVWQDFMFAGGMYPGDTYFFASIKEEVRCQVKRLSKYDCIKLWCGNNEIDEAWHHWGWQNQFNLHGADSVKVWNDYTRLFRDSLPAWVKEFDEAERPYTSTSPRYGWGNPLSYTNSDSHYWGLWWGLEGWEKFKTHTGRFVSEWGMQAMPDYSTVEKYTPADQRYVNSPAVNAHQKANDGFKKLNHYVNKYFFDTMQLATLSLEEYTYLTQCVQYYILKNSLATQMSQQPVNMGTLIWQLNDCWPVTSWSLIDFYKKPKAGYYAAKNAFLNMDTVTDKMYPKELRLKKATVIIKKMTAGSITIQSDTDAKYVCISVGDMQGYFSDNYFDLVAGEEKTLLFKGGNLLKANRQVKFITLADIVSK